MPCLAHWLPFNGTFFFPCGARVGHLSAGSLLGGIGMQLLWTAIGAAMVWFFWRRSVKHYSAVGN